MQTQLLSIASSEDINKVASLLKEGNLVAVPTETVYGLAADATNPEAVARIFVAKNRPQDHPLITHIHSAEVLSDWAKDIPDYVGKLTDVFWPGPLTLILPKQDHVSDVITGGHNTIGLRMPNQPALLDILREYNLAIAAPSANPYQQLSPTTAEQVMDGLSGRIAAVLDGGQCTVGTESTILSVSKTEAKILRAGAISYDDLLPYIPVPLHQPAEHSQAVSGNKEVHYQPRTMVVITSTEDIQSSINKSEGVGVLSYSSELVDLMHEPKIHLSDNVTEYRHDLYRSLYELDQHALSEIWVEQPPTGNDWLDINDRLSKASA